MADGTNKSDLSLQPSETVRAQQTTDVRRRPSPGPTPNAAAVAVRDSQEKDDDTEADTDNESKVSEDEYDSRQKTRHIGSKSYSAVEERTVLRKLDRRLTIFLCILYLLSFLDRSNIGNARVAGLQTSLGITDSQFDQTLLAFYVTYITFEWMILLYGLIPPHVYIALCVFSWGITACLQSVVTSFTQLLILRAVLGITEAAFGPGVPFYMTFFYRRDELAYRVGLQISAAPLATSFASSLAWVIVKLSEHSPLESWRALFLFEGFPSLIAAVFAYYIIADSPAQARWLTPRERQIATLRLKASSPNSALSSDTLTANSSRVKHSTSKLNPREILRTLSDPKAWLPALMFLSVNVSFASLPVFLPTIINSMSFSALTSQILAAPPYLVAFVFVLLTARASDRIPDSRSIFLMASAGLSCVSYATIAVTGTLSANGILGATASIVIRYVAIYGAAMGLFTSVVLIITWQLNNQASTTGKGVGMVILNVVGQTGPLIGVKLFPGGDGPYFVRGMAVCAGFMGLVALLAGGLRLYLARLNGRIDGGEGGRGRYEMVVVRRAEAEAEEAEGLVGDASRGGDEDRYWGDDDGGSEGQEFRYML